MVDGWTQWNSDKEDKESGVITPEVEGALITAAAMTKPLSQEELRIRKRANHNSWKRTPFKGYSAKYSDMARHIIGLKYSGYALKEVFDSAAEKYGVKWKTVENMYYGKKDLIDLAEVEHVGLAIKEYEFNRATCRTMLSEAGPLAVQALIEAMSDERATPNVKLKSATAVIKMLDLDGSASGGQSSDAVAKESLKLVRDVLNQRKEEQESHIIDAEDVEFLEGDNEGESGTSDCM